MWWDIIELHTDISTEQFRRMAHAYVLYDVVLMVAKLVKIAIDFWEIHIFVKVVFQIFHRSSLASWICQTGFHKLAEHFVVNTIETNPVKRAVQYQEKTNRLVYSFLVNLSAV